MIQQTIAEIEARLAESKTVKDKEKAELQSLLANLREEIEQLSRTHAPQAQAIADYTRASAERAIQRNPAHEETKPPFHHLSESVTEFEKTHPQLVQVVNRIATILSNLGI